MRTAALLVAVTLALAPAAGADTPSFQVPIGARALGLAGAFSAIADDGTALFWNPAGLARIGHQELSASHANLFRSGIRDGVASFVLPLSPGQTVAMDWYRSGFDDGQLGFAENRIAAGWAMQVRAGLWAGVGAKLLTRRLELDGATLSEGRGYGLDAGLLAAPVDRLRLALVAQDVLDTRIESDLGDAAVAYPRNLRLGASYSWPRRATLAFDLDDRWHLGVEATPIDAIALRAGVEDDRDTGEPPTWTYGIGVQAGIFRADWARVEHPTLEHTDHFTVATEFNFNPPQVRLEQLAPRDLFGSLAPSYAHEPVGTVQVRNLQDRPLVTTLGVWVPELMSAPTEREVVLRPRAVQEVALNAVLDERALSAAADRPIQLQVTASYRSRRVMRRERASAKTIAYAPGAIDWSAGTAQAAAFVTTRDPAVDAVAREAARRVAGHDPAAFGCRNLAHAAATFEALAALGVAYVPDPHNPYGAISQTSRAVDTIHYPHQTLARRTGDCDDTTVLLASLLGNLGVATRFVDVPGHIFLLVATGVHARHAAVLGIDSTHYVVLDQQVWVPVETTRLRDGFVEAWRAGAEQIASATRRGDLETIDVAAAQERFEPAYAAGPRVAAVPDSAEFERRWSRAAAEIAARRESHLAARLARLGPATSSPAALLEVARVLVLGGDFAGARTQLLRAADLDPASSVVHHDLAVTLAAMDSLEAAERHSRTALALSGGNAGEWLNLGLIGWARGDTAEAAMSVARGIELAGGYEAACHLLTLAPEDSLERGTADTLATDLRALLRAAAARAAESPARAVPAAAPRARAPLAPARVAPGLHRHLHWAE